MAHTGELDTQPQVGLNLESSGGYPGSAFDTVLDASGERSCDVEGVLEPDANAMHHGSGESMRLEGYESIEMPSCRSTSEGLKTN